MYKNLRKKTDGFTIIEVLIVLAIAGLIMLVVFLAVPALQRNQRNTSRRSDIGRIGGAVTEWTTNNNGAVLTPGTGNANLTAILNNTGTLSQYTLTAQSSIQANSFTLANGTNVAMPAGNNNVNLGSVQVVVGATCGTNGATVANPSQRRMVLQYLVENANGVTPLCQEI